MSVFLSRKRFHTPLWNLPQYAAQMLCMYDVLEYSTVKILSEAKSQVQIFRESMNQGFRDLERVEELERRAREASTRLHATTGNRDSQNESSTSMLRGYNLLWVFGLSPQTRVIGNS